MNVIVRQFDVVDYVVALERMRAHVDARTDACADEIWFLQHNRVFTQGQGGRAEHVHNPGDIPVIQSDRGGQVTYHGPGQLIAYVMVDLRRLGIGPRELVKRLEASVIRLLSDFGIVAGRRTGAPGVYVGPAKISALGLRIRRGLSFHGLSLNVDPDLEPFGRIDPCGYRNLGVTSLEQLGVQIGCGAVAQCLRPHLVRALYGPHAGVTVESGAGEPAFMGRGNSVGAEQTADPMRVSTIPERATPMTGDYDQ